jgi:hypothetical protein
MDADAKYSRVLSVESDEVGDDDDDDEEDERRDDDTKAGARSFPTQLLPLWLDNQQQVAHDAATSQVKQREHFLRQLFVFELYVWAAAFVALGCYAAS